MRRPALVVAVVSLAGALAGGCAKPSPPEPLHGAWSAEDADAKRHTLSFEDGGRATWAITGGGETQSYQIRYDFDDGVSPHKLDLSGFESGALAGKTLYCILEFEPANAFRMDCEAGTPGEGGDTLRPATFGDSALVYVKDE